MTYDTGLSVRKDITQDNARFTRDLRRSREERSGQVERVSGFTINRDNIPFGEILRCRRRSFSLGIWRSCSVEVYTIRTRLNSTVRSPASHLINKGKR